MKKIKVIAMLGTIFGEQYLQSVSRAMKFRRFPRHEQIDMWETRITEQLFGVSQSSVWWLTKRERMMGEVILAQSELIEVLKDQEVECSQSQI